MFAGSRANPAHVRKEPRIGVYQGMSNSERGLQTVGLDQMEKQATGFHEASTWCQQ